MPAFADCYVLVGSRSKTLVEDFLAHFLPHHIASADEYQVPQYSDKPEHVFPTACDVLSYLERHASEAHALYWANEDPGNVRFGLVFPTSDGQMIFGISCDSDNEKVANKLLHSMKQFFKTEFGYITGEEPPPETAQEFMEIVESLN